MIGTFRNSWDYSWRDLWQDCLSPVRLRKPEDVSYYALEMCVCRRNVARRKGLRSEHHVS